MSTEPKLQGTVFEYISGSSKGGRFWTGYQDKYDVGDIDGNTKVIGHYYSEDECIQRCHASAKNRSVFEDQMNGIVELNGKRFNIRTMEYLED